MTNLFDDWVPVVPAKGELRETAVALLAVAKNPALVRTESNGTEFLVPEWVAREFTGSAPAPAPRKRRASAARVKDQEVS